MQMTEIVVTIVVTTIASSGLWTFLSGQLANRGATRQLLKGIAHDRIVTLGIQYIRRGWISRYEYDTFIHTLYDPYIKIGGNGLCKNVMGQVDQLMIKDIAFDKILEVIDDEQKSSNE